MGREVRKVPVTWQHPKKNGCYISLHTKDCKKLFKEPATCYQMYENTTEGTPISPVMSSIKDLAKWLADNKVSFFGSTSLNYENWLEICKKQEVDTFIELDMSKQEIKIRGILC